MKVVINKSELSLATLRSQGAILDKTLTQIGLKASENRLHVNVSDRILAIYSSLDSTVLEEGEVFVPAKIFSDVVRELPDGMVTLEKSESNLLIVAGHNNEFSMKLPRIQDKMWREVPQIGSLDFADLSAEDLFFMIDQIQFCVSNESARNYGTVGYLHRLDGKDKIRLVGTDGFRLSLVELSGKIPDHFLLEGVCLSKRALNELHKMCSEGFEQIRLSISEDKTTLCASVPDYQIFIRLSAVKYPQYEGVLPSTNLTEVEVSRTYLQSVTKRVLLAADKSKALHLCFSDSLLTLKSHTIGSSEGKESVVLEDYHEGERELAINGKFLSDIFSTVSTDKININFKTEDDPVVIFPKKGLEPKNCSSMHILVPIKESH